MTVTKQTNKKKRNITYKTPYIHKTMNKKH